METDDNQSIPFTILKKYHDRIVQDIQGDVIMILFKKQVLTENEYRNIKFERNREKEACRLLELLPSKGRNGINQFINYLSIHYPWIAGLLQHSITNKYNYMFSKEIQEILTAGEVPQLSSRHISRVEHVKTLKKLLTELEANNFIIVNGMTGCGKSSLVVEVLNDPFITMQYFQGFVQWINVGRENSSHAECIQTEILNRLNNQEQLITPPLIIDYEATRKKIRRLWKEKQLTGLLILDDVCSNEVVKFLDIGCKILITTNDISIMDGIIDTRVKYLKVNEGFEEKETLNLFSKCLNVDLKSLPSHASKLHSICKGFPLTISLIASQLEMHREEAINNTDRWEFYLNKLSDKTSKPFKYNSHSQNQLKSLEKTIEMCIKSLPSDLQKNYRDFSLFVDDLNIKPEVLSILWNIKKTEVTDIMSELMRKSLVVRAWNQPLNSYVYSIHDLLLSNLKRLISHQEYKELHKKCIDHYRNYCKGNFANLPKNDNYIFLYFGYHLKNADMLEEFPKWFLNLRFIESKICATGPADLLADLKKYKIYIVVKSIHEEYIKEIENFVKRYGPNLYRTKCDIVQLGLQEPETSFIYNESYKLAKASGKLYFYYDIRPSQNFHPEPHISIVRDKIETVIFGNRHDEVLIATNSGSIKLWNIISDRCLYTYNGHTKRVTHLAKNKLKNLFLSTSDDSTIRIWNMNSFPESENSQTRTPSPETRQEHWQNVFRQDFKRPIENTNADCIYVLEHDSPVIFAQFSPNDRLVVSSSTDKTLKIWKLNDDNYKIQKSIMQNHIINRCYFVENKTCDSDKILFSTFGSIVSSGIYGCEFPFDHCTGLLYFKEKLLSFFHLPSSEGQDKMLVMTPTLLQSYDFNWENEKKTTPPLVYPKPIGYRQYKLISISEENTNNFSRYIAFSLSNSTIKICDLSNGYNFLDLYNSNEGISNLDWFWSKTDQSFWLLSAANKSIRLWCLKDIKQYACAHRTISTNQSNSNIENMCKNEMLSLQNYKLFSEEQNLYCYKLQRNFDAVWLDNDSVLVAAVTKCGTLKILFEGLDQWSMINESVLALTIVHPHQFFDQTMIIVACKNLSVYCMKFHKAEYLFKTSQMVDQIFACFDNDDLTIAFLLKQCIKVNEKKIDQAIEIWSNKKKYEVFVHDFINCFLFHDKVILLYNVHGIYILNLRDESKIKLEINCIKINGSLMLDSSNLAVVDNGNYLKIYQLTSDFCLNLIDQYPLPFLEYEVTPISISNNKKLIAIGGQKHIVLIDNTLKTRKCYKIGPNVNNIQSMVWSSDNTRIAIKEDNQIITLDVESGKILASVRLTVDKFFVNSVLNKYIAVNTTGQLVKLNLYSDS
ncbi:apoptotic protease-activating factor 1-like [Rhopalosiphum maidis]|uniref:apoptotic protease-activating factor 1-like n=1 Tax=Rhopalosiphum maidis TaxID=43146 RepID=UPI000F002BAD|nr:apoptotic protease-activating factor 1-like [Rhopalosiphum maidis]